MSKLLDTIESPEWWISVVVVGLIINLASAYLKPWIDRTTVRFSEKRRQKRDQQNKEFELLVESLINEPIREQNFRFSSYF
jgi:hypothetical protein